MSQLNNAFEAIIEISANSPPVKYEFDPETRMLRVDRFMSTSMVYPCNYGFIPNTLGGDGDPVDVLVHTRHSVQAGTIMTVRAIGILYTEDEKGVDPKILAVPTLKIDPFLDISDYTDLPVIFRKQIEHFFTHYKDLEQGKWVKVLHWGSREEAVKFIIKAMVASC